MAHYAVSFRRSAEKDLRKLDAGMRRRVPDVIRSGRKLRP
jgi:mRNA-degrading endonuclease RelE of RelBE toxin-antitoxin system